MYKGTSIQTKSAVLVPFFWITCILIGIRLFMSFPMFELLGIHPAALHLFHDQITLHDFSQTTINKFLFSPPEVEHFVQVKAKFILINHILLAVLPLWILCFTFKRDVLAKTALYTAYMSIAILLLFGILFALELWKPLTSAFHHLAFPDGNWRFPTGSLTIRLYPKWLMQIGAVFTFSFAFLSALGVHFLSNKINRSG